MDSIFRSLHVIASRLGEAVVLRGRLVSLEWARERQRAVALSLWTLATLLLLLMAMVVGTFAVAVVFWETHRVFALTAIAGFYALLGLISLGGLWCYLRSAPPLFHETMTVLQQDSACHFLPPQSPSQN